MLYLRKKDKTLVGKEHVRTNLSLDREAQEETKNCLKR